MAVEITVFGINHFDPLGRSKIAFELEKMKTQDVSPDYVAVEWEENFAHELIMNRGLFEKKFDSIIGVSAATLHALALTIAYEADVSLDVFPDIRTIWLDNDRIINYPVLDYLADRARIYEDVLSELTPEYRDSVDRISRNLWARTEISAWEPTPRDEAFVQQITNIILSGNERIIVITGAHHANPMNDRSVAFLIKHMGFDLDIKILKP